MTAQEIAAMAHTDRRSDSSDLGALCEECVALMIAHKQTDNEAQKYFLRIEIASILNAVQNRRRIV